MSKELEKTMNGTTVKDSGESQFTSINSRLQPGSWHAKFRDGFFTGSPGLFSTGQPSLAMASSGYFNLSDCTFPEKTNVWTSFSNFTMIKMIQFTESWTH